MPGKIARRPTTLQAALVGFAELQLGVLAVDLPSRGGKEITGKPKITIYDWSTRLKG
ncbi:hypothetical protein OG258_07690 [Streptomyces mirabilis]|uniref:hypothetical protein n=1 Tax=Streptomyces mirabilis TaxID=68239 RepID=UPI002E2DB022|nr:hypothetical protein [Streptomyces mirabilis]